MKYNFKGYVFLGVSCNGMSHSYEDLVPIDLSEEEVTILRTQVKPNEDGDIVPCLRKDFPQLFQKIDKEGSVFAKYASVHEGVITGLFEEYLEDKSKLLDFSEEYLATLSFHDRIQYVAKSFDLGPEEFADIDNQYSLELPEELKR